jgi:hypothetical protein
MASTLNATSNDGTAPQTTTQDPQTDSGQQGNLQPVNTSTSILSNVGGQQLENKVLPSAQLQATTISTQPDVPVNTAHHNAGLTTISIILFVVAVVLFASTTRSSKSTTK